MRVGVGAFLWWLCGLMFTPPPFLSCVGVTYIVWNLTMDFMQAGDEAVVITIVDEEENNANND